MLKIFSIVVGVVVYVLVVALLAPVDHYVQLFFANLVGGIVAGLIGRKNGLVLGGVLSILVFLYLYWVLFRISNAGLAGELHYPEIKHLYPNLAAVVFGPVGGLVGEKIFQEFWGHHT